MHSPTLLLINIIPCLIIPLALIKGIQTFTLIKSFVTIFGDTQKISLNGLSKLIMLCSLMLLLLMISVVAILLHQLWLVKIAMAFTSIVLDYYVFTYFIATRTLTHYCKTSKHISLDDMYIFILYCTVCTSRYLCAYDTYTYKHTDVHNAHICIHLYYIAVYARSKSTANVWFIIW